MKNFGLKMCLAAFTLLAITSLPVYGAGLGFYGSFNYGYNLFEEKVMSGTGSDDCGEDLKCIDTYQMGYNAGIAIDSNVSMDKAFNYRLYLGFGQVNREFTGDVKARINMFDGSMTHTFGFSLVRKKAVRFYLGPQLALGYSWGKSPVDRRYYDEIRAMLGPVFGLNINIGPCLTLFWDFGGRMGYLIGNSRGYEFNGNLTGFSFEAFTSAGVMFRIKDSYAASVERTTEKLDVEYYDYK